MLIYLKKAKICLLLSCLCIFMENLIPRFREKKIANFTETKFAVDFAVDTQNRRIKFHEIFFFENLFQRKFLPLMRLQNLDV